MVSKKLREFLRNLKVTSIVYNLLHYSQLTHNRKGYQRFGIKRPLFWSINSDTFKNISYDKPWLDRPNALEAIEADTKLSSFAPATQETLKNWPLNGYAILSQCLSPEEVDKINSTITNLVETNKVHFRYNQRKIMFAMHHSEYINAIAHDTRITSVMEYILQMPVVPFQTINFMRGSEQKAHSDSIHMTTFPPGYLIAAWIALEDIDEENGPLFYLPGSHQLPYLLNNGYDHGGGKLVLGSEAYEKYEVHLENEIKNTAYKEVSFTAKKGDVLIWHGNLLHGGRPILNPERTRKSMVIHFYGRDVIKYHEITQRPSLLKV
ncbi:MAG: phytanoyl-CoA dioxygenase family protein [Cytophagaceae bacterium]